MNVLRFPLGELQANCYLLIQNSSCLIIDPGDSAEFILEEVQRKNLHVEGICATHGHFDHVMAVGEVQLSLQVPFYFHSADMFLLKRVRSTAEHFLGHSPVVVQPQEIRDIKNNEIIRIGEIEIKILHTPGHTPGSCCFYLPSEQTLFTGDTLLEHEVGDYSHSYSDRRTLFLSITTIRSLPEGTTMYPGHGEDFLL